DFELETDQGPSNSSSRRRSVRENDILEFPSICEFQPITKEERNNMIPRGAYFKVPSGLNPHHMEPFDFFQLILPLEALKKIAENSTEYMNSQSNVLEDSSSDSENEDDNVSLPPGRDRFITYSDVLRYVSFCIKMGVFQAPADRDYWRTDPQYPDFKFNNIMSFRRFQLLKRFLHVSKHDDDHDHYSSKVKWLADEIENNSRKYYSPSATLSVDEMMIRFGGRSKDTYRIRGKPISEGYKILALCDSGFTYAFLFASSRERTILEEDFRGESFNETQKEVLALAHKLPKGHFDIFMDNYFSSIKLFQKLR
ncbi:hypothetical protein MP638_003354, partial [Amoeboaphelidium occidentale]